MTNEIQPAPICKSLLWANTVGLNHGAPATLLWTANPINAPVTALRALVVNVGCSQLEERCLALD